MFSYIYTLFTGRSPRWPKVREDWLRRHDLCAACDASKDLEVHHIMPIQMAPYAELDTDNLITLCKRCHLFVGHLGDFYSWNDDVETDAAIWLRKVRTRPYQSGKADR